MARKQFVSVEVSETPWGGIGERGVDIIADSLSKRISRNYFPNGGAASRTRTSAQKTLTFNVNGSTNLVVNKSLGKPF